MSGLVMAGTVSALCSPATIVTSLVGLVTLVIRLAKRQRIVSGIFLLAAFPIELLLGIVVFGNQGSNGVIIISSLLAPAVSLAGYFVFRMGAGVTGTAKIVTR